MDYYISCSEKSSSDSKNKWEFVTHFGGIGNDQPISSVIDCYGNVYVSGFFTSPQLNFYFRTTNTISNNIRQLTINNTENSVNREGFVAKLNCDGNWEYVCQFGGSIREEPVSLITDCHGNVYVSGFFSSTQLNFYFCTTDTTSNNIPQLTINNNGNRDGFVAKLTCDGNWKYVCPFGGTDRDQPVSLITDCHGNVYVSGFFDSTQLNFYFCTIDIISNNTPQLTINNIGDRDGFVAKLNCDGNWEHVCQFGGTNFDGPISLITDCHGNVYVAGVFFSNQLNFYFCTTDTISNNIPQLTINNSGSNDGFVAKLNCDGNWVYVCPFGGIIIDQPISSVIDCYGNVYVAGFFTSPQLNFYFCTTNSISNNIPQLTIKNSGNSNEFVAKLNCDGNWVYVCPFGGNDFNQIKSLITDCHGNVYVSGFFYSTQLNFYFCTTDTISNNIPQLTIKNYGTNVIRRNDGFVAKLTCDGNWKYVCQFGGTNFDQPISLITDCHGNVYVSGFFELPQLNFYFCTTDTISNNISQLNIKNYGANDGFVAKLNCDGNWVYVCQFSGTNNDLPISLITDCHGNVYVSGYFVSNQLNFYGCTTDNISNNISQLTIKNYGSANGFISKISNYN